MGERERIILIEDSRFVREGLRRWFEFDGHQIIGEAGSLEEAQVLVDNGGFSVAIVDGGFPEKTGSGKVSRGAGSAVSALIRQRREKKGERITIISFSLGDVSFGDHNPGKVASPGELSKIIRNF